MDDWPVMAFLLCERVAMSPDSKTVTLYSAFDGIEVPPRGSRILFAFYKVRLGGPGKLELRVFDPVRRLVMEYSDEWPSGGTVVQSQWAFTTDKLTQRGTYSFELHNGYRRLARTDLEVRQTQS